MKNFNTNVTIRVILISLSSITAAWFLSNHYYFSASVLLAILILQIFLFLRFVGKTNENIKQFLEGIRYNDFSGSFTTEGMGYNHEKLGKTFDCVIKDFQNIRSEKEEQNLILQNILQHINVGLLVFKSDGEIIIHNTAFKNFFRLQNSKNINDHARYHPEISELFNELKEKEKILFKRVQDEDILQLAIFKTNFNLQGESLTLLTVYDIQPELDENEMESWQKLIRVLTHEIMNSITPISSLSGTLKTMMKTSESITSNLDDILAAINSIERRSFGLIDFVEKYRSLTRIPKPDFAIIRLTEYLPHILKLISPDCTSHNIAIEIKLQQENIEIVADEGQIEQVLINIIKNACQALSDIDNPKIIIKGLVNEHGNPEIQITDNGPGIIPEVLDKIFIPFYTTKTDGSGIGLSICRQIMRLHRGSIFVSSIPGATTFYLRFT